MGLLYERAGRLTVKNGGFRPGQLHGWAAPLALGAAGAAELRAKACYLGCLLQAELATGELCHFGRR
jgi:hypothetical protein